MAKIPEKQTRSGEFSHVQKNNKQAKKPAPKPTPSPTPKPKPKDK